MRKNNVKSLLFLASASTLVASCDLMKDVSYTVKPNPLELHGDSVKISFEAKVPAKGIKKKVSAEITPMLGNTALKTITIQGERVTGNGKVIEYKPGGTVKYKDVVLYNPSMETADLTVSGKIKKGKKEKKQIPATKIADATIVTPLLVQKDFRVITEKDNFNRVTEQTFQSKVNYAKASSVISAAELKNNTILEFQHWLAAAETNPKITIKSINIVGFASPEGEVGTNELLGTDRATSAKNLGIELAKKGNNKKAQTEIYSITTKGEDFDGFKVELEKSTMNADDKQLIIRVLEMYKDPVQRETEMRNLGKSFTFLDQHIFPKLRRAEITVVYDLVGHTDEELVAMSKSSIDKMTAEELLFVATLTQDNAEKLRLYNEGCLLFPTDIRFHNNAGAQLFMQGNLTDAAFKFEAANSLKDNAVSKNNLGAVYGKNGDKAKAKQLFESAKGAGDETNYNLGIYAIQEGDYAEALSNFGDMKTFNTALAQILNTNADLATKTIDESADKDSAMSYYLKAIAAARQEKGDVVAANLKKAIEKDASLKAKAAKDREFLKVAGNSAVKEVLM